MIHFRLLINPRRQAWTSDWEVNDAIISENELLDKHLAEYKD
jgi:hypothetical protein